MNTHYFIYMGHAHGGALEYCLGAIAGSHEAMHRALRSLSSLPCVSRTQVWQITTPKNTWLVAPPRGKSN